MRVTTATEEGYAIALTDAGDVYSWGKSYRGRLGHSNADNQRTPKLVEALAGKDCKQVRRRRGEVERRKERGGRRGTEGKKKGERDDGDGRAVEGREEWKGEMCICGSRSLHHSVPSPTGES